MATEITIRLAIFSSNGSGMNSSAEQCLISSMFIFDYRYLLAQLIQISICILTIILVALWRKFIIRQLMNENSKIHHMIYDFIFATDSCDYIFSNFKCMFVKILTHCFNVNLPLLFICICIERTLATHSLRDYRDKTYRLFLFAPIFTLVLSLSFASSVFYIDAYDPLDTASCLFNTNASWYPLNNMYYCLIGINLSAMVWICLLYLKNRQLEQRISDKNTLTSRYQVKENLHITKVILIAGSIQLIVTLLHEITNSVRRAFVNSFPKWIYRELAVYNYFITYANLLFLFVLYILLQKQQKNKIEVIRNDIETRKTESAGGYFAQYSW